ncbi:hypothetical protein [Thalassotalea sp. ND16A]|uniref:hypothetical protein n=1 Tax=Thalassotalea sp. ND16A TaxID=1535422 RepID=UPI00051D0E95|nr:hypothetical protein [Thalassotalea sp. ND16A]KGJ98743.1 hypothetical protein ND16A_0546 [Thalassotalea sp. ND16A]
MEDEKKYLFDHPKNIKRILRLLYGCYILLFALDFVIHRREYEGDPGNVGWSMS